MGAKWEVPLWAINGHPPLQNPVQTAKQRKTDAYAATSLVPLCQRALCWPPEHARNTLEKDLEKWPKILHGFVCATQNPSIGRMSRYCLHYVAIWLHDAAKLLAAFLLCICRVAACRNFWCIFRAGLQPAQPSSTKRIVEGIAVGLGTTLALHS